jgi:hypothetical protein
LFIHTVGKDNRAANSTLLKILKQGLATVPKTGRKPEFSGGKVQALTDHKAQTARIETCTKNAHLHPPPPHLLCVKKEAVKLRVD